VVVAGPPDGSRALLEEVARHYLPFAIVIPVLAGTTQEAVSRILPFTAAMSPRGEDAAAYVCREFTCRQPVTNAADLHRELAGASNT
jgi:uncharacterized protein YyaL (SSP411 family)